ncbi:MAG TPA: Gfo/Idh/MocA family oxidoreductase [Candidatus Acidoferrales bacterium]|nr:Gfo/Idh/MocA family oxidoreductase [Candidatus Acidoferrales bacterium]
MAERKRLNAAVVGLGYWGPNLVRNLADSDGWNVRWIVDADERRLAAIERRYPQCRTSTDLATVLRDGELDLVALATPPSTHFTMAGDAIAAGKHVLVEKPLAERSADARALLDLAGRNEVKLFTDHTFLYTGAVETMHRMLHAGELGDVYYIESQRVNLGLFQQTNVVWDLAPHDVSIFNYVLGRLPTAVSCHTRACINPSVADVAFLQLRYADDCTAAVHLSWLSPVKVRRMMLSASARMLLWDDVDPSEKLRIYDKGVLLNPSSKTLTQQMISYRLGDVRIPMLDGREALAKLFDDVWHDVAENRPARVGGSFGYDVVRCIEAAIESSETGGRWIPVEGAGDASRRTAVDGKIASESLV